MPVSLNRINDSRRGHNGEEYSYFTALKWGKLHVRLLMPPWNLHCLISKGHPSPFLSCEYRGLRYNREDTDCDIAYISFTGTVYGYTINPLVSMRTMLGYHDLYDLGGGNARCIEVKPPDRGLCRHILTTIHGYYFSTCVHVV